MAKTHEVAQDLIEEMATNAYQWPTDRFALKRAFGVHEVDPITTLLAQVANLSKQIRSLTINGIHTPVEVCNICNGEHASMDCHMGNSLIPSQPEHAQFIGNYNRQQNNPFSNTSNPGWQNHMNFSWKNSQNVMKQPPGFQPSGVQSQPQASKVSLEDALAQLTVNMSQFMARTYATLQRQETSIQNQATSIRNIEVQIG